MSFSYCQCLHWCLNILNQQLTFIAYAQRVVLAMLLVSPTVLAATAYSEQELKEQHIMLGVTIKKRSYQLETLLITPPGSGPFPLAVITHGSPRKTSAQAGMTPRGFSAQATEFARRGYLTAIVMRRGYGQSEGSWAEGFGSCNTPNYRGAIKQTAKDLNAAIIALKERSNVDDSRIVVVGQSAGGVGAIALAADNVSGVHAVINFAGGRGSRRHGEVCAKRELIKAFKHFGKTADIPMLWVYAENDGFFNPRLASSFHKAFTESGGQAQLVQTEAFGREGHNLFSKKGIAIWRPLVDDFLRQTQLPTWDIAPEIIEVAQLPPPKGLSTRGKEHWERYLEKADHKAFAKSKNGTAFGWRSGRNTIEQAKEKALRNCKKRATDCVVVSVNGEYVEE